MECKVLVRSEMSCSRTTGDTCSEMLDYVLELLNTQKLYSLLLLDTAPDPKPSGERKWRYLWICISLSRSILRENKKIELPWSLEVESTLFFYCLHFWSTWLVCPEFYPLWTKMNPASGFIFQSYLQNQPSSLLSSKSSRRKAGCMVISRLKQFRCPQLEANTEGKIFLQVPYFLGETSHNNFGVEKMLLETLAIFNSFSDQFSYLLYIVLVPFFPFNLCLALRPHYKEDQRH